MHAAPGVQVTQVPVASQTEPVPHAVPAARSAPVSAQVAVPVAQSKDPTWQAFVGWHDVPQLTPRKSQLAVTLPWAPQSMMYAPWRRSGPITGRSV